MISQPPYVWYHIEYTCDTWATVFMTSYPPCMTTQHCVLLILQSAYVTSFVLQVISHPLYHTKPQYLWCLMHYRHDITTTVSLSSKPLHWYHTQFCMKSYQICMTSYPQYVWHHMHSVEHHIHSLCHHTTVLMTSQPLYMNAHLVCMATYTLYMWHHSK